MPRPVELESIVTGRGALLERVEDYFVGRFDAMASPCSVLLDVDERAVAAQLVDLAVQETRRIEQKFSRYRKENPIFRINTAAGQPVAVDPETAQLIEYAATCWSASDGMFDITSGVLRRVWTFDGGNRVPSRDAIAACLELVGWARASWQDDVLTLPAGMEIDLGGIGKEYAVDRVAALLAPRAPGAFVVNFGGDLYASGPRRGQRPWGVGIDDPRDTGRATLRRLDVARAGLATSGDARRFVRWRGKRLGHILNPKTGWPVMGGPRSITVLAPTCLEAGTLSTLACLRGAGAGEFLDEQGVEYWLG